MYPLSEIATIEKPAWTVMIGPRWALSDTFGFNAVVNSDVARAHLAHGLLNADDMLTLRRHWLKWGLDVAFLSRAWDNAFVSYLSGEVSRGHLAVALIPVQLAHFGAASRLRSLHGAPADRSLQQGGGAQPPRGPLLRGPAAVKAGLADPRFARARQAAASTFADGEIGRMNLYERFEQSILLAIPSDLLTNEARVELQDLLESKIVYRTMGAMQSLYNSRCGVVASGLALLRTDYFGDLSNARLVEGLSKLDKALETAALARVASEMRLAAEHLADAVHLLGVRPFKWLLSPRLLTTVSEGKKSGAAPGGEAAAPARVKSASPPVPALAQSDANKTPKRAPKSEDRPKLEKIASDPTVAAAIEKAWKDSKPNAKENKSKQEKGFWVTKDKKTGALSVVQFPDNGTNDGLTPGSPPNETGKDTVAFFHTHPNIGDGYVSEPSDADENFAKSKGIPGIIKSHDGMYYFGPDK